MTFIDELMSKMFRPPRVLLMEHEEATGRQYASVLTDKHNCKVDWVRSGADALEHLKLETYDIVLMEMRAGDLDVLKYIKKCDPCLPVVMITSYVADAIWREALRMGVVGMLPKSTATDNFGTLFKTYGIRVMADASA